MPEDMDDATQETIFTLRKQANQLREMGHAGALAAAKRTEELIQILEGGDPCGPIEVLPPPPVVIESVNLKMQLALIDASARVLAGPRDESAMRQRAGQFLKEMYDLYSPSAVERRKEARDA